jgi:hypothetical protein
LILSGGGKSKELKDGDLLRGFHAREGFFHDSEDDDASKDADVSKLHFPEYIKGSVGRLDLQILPPASNPAAAAAKAARFRRVRSVLEQQQLLHLYDAVFAQAHAPASS